MSDKWYIETWAPYDGIAFASRRRESEALDASGERGAVVVLQPPYWRPVRVGLGTAFRAERGPFQVGFFDKAQTPIGFDSLAELVAVVRQAYLAAGGGPPPGETAPFPSEGLPSPPDIYDANNFWPIVRGKLLGGPGSDADAQKFGRDVAIVVGRQLAKLFEYFAVVTLRLLAERTDSTTDDLVDWSVVLGRMGLGNLAIHEVSSLQPSPEWAEWYWHTFRWTSSRTGGSGAILGGLLFRVPDPLKKTPAASLGDTLTQILARRGRVATLPFETFAVVVFAAAAVIAATRAIPLKPCPGLGAGPGHWIFELHQQAAAWLFRNLPSVPEHTPAGEALEGWSP